MQGRVTVAEEWAGCSANLGFGVGKPAKGLASWAVAWGTDELGGAWCAEVSRPDESHLFGGRLLGKGAPEQMRQTFAQALAAKRRKGYSPVEFNDPKRGNVPSFSSGEAYTLALAGIPAEQLTLERAKLSPEGMRADMSRLGAALGAGFTSAANTKVLLLELRQLGKRIEAYCAGGGTECEALQAEMDSLKRAAAEALAS